MSTETLTRRSIVDALDELGERNSLSYAQRTASDDPYSPPSVVAERLESLRRDRQLAWGMLGLAGVAVAFVCLGILFRWPVEFAVGFLLLGAPALTGGGIHKLSYGDRAEQLYEVLRRIDDVPETETVPQSSVVEVA
ncbi:hypothetical protein [Salinibacter altiplanensis]|uniref:hypothetical protein n=1 Tax=Salinibacter altiplanensis TaxID=1803181 RepID=UPI00131A4EB0|nr:hypothetical protein [Salinibacter altiplanensis]